MELIEKLSNSDAVKSLQVEMNIATELNKFNWQVTCNPYYVDGITGKFRELDLLAQRGCRLAKKEISFEINLLIEAKSIADYHIVFSQPARFHSCDIDSQCIGNTYKDNVSVINILKEHGFSPMDLRDLAKEYNALFYPKQSWLFAEHQYHFFNDLESFYSFRETNIGKTKELENAVLWKAFSELLSVNKFIGNKNVYDFQQDLRYYFEKQNLHNKLTLALECIENYSRIIQYFHPVLVLDSHLWKLNPDGRLSGLPYARLIQAELSGMANFWIDVVQRDHLPEYIQKMDSHMKNWYTADIEPFNK